MSQSDTGLLTRRNGASCGFISGLALLWLLAHRTKKNSPFSNLKLSFSEGVCYGLGGGWGVIWGIGLLSRAALLLEERELRAIQEKANSLPKETGAGQLEDSPSLAPAAAAGTVEVGTPEEGLSPPPNTQAPPTPPPTDSALLNTKGKGNQTQSKQITHPNSAVGAPETEAGPPVGPVVFAQGFVAGALGAVVFAIVKSLGLLAVGPLLFRGRLRHLGQHLEAFTSIDWENPQHRQNRRRQMLQGSAIGFGFIIAGAALNWGVEQWDRILGGEEAPHSS